MGRCMGVFWRKPTKTQPGKTARKAKLVRPSKTAKRARAKQRSAAIRAKSPLTPQSPTLNQTPGSAWTNEEDLKLLYLFSNNVTAKQIMSGYLNHRTLQSIYMRHHQLKKRVKKMDDDTKNALDQAIKEVGKMEGLEI